MNLGGDDHLVALGEVADRTAENLLADAAGIDIGRIEEIDARFERTLDEGARRILGQHPLAPFRGAVGHAAETNARNFDARGAEADIAHGENPFGWRVGAALGEGAGTGSMRGSPFRMGGTS
jgi:hypothetical protein